MAYHTSQVQSVFSQEIFDQSLTAEGFAHLFGVSVAELSQPLRNKIESHDFAFLVPDDGVQHSMLCDIRRKTAFGQFSIAGASNKSRWERGWQENYRDFVKSDYDLNALVPRFIRPGQPMRLDGKFVQTRGAQVRVELVADLSESGLLGSSYLDFRTYSNSVVAPALTWRRWHKLCPKAVFTAWTGHLRQLRSSRPIAKRHGLALKARLFDFFAPDMNIEVPENSAFFTVCALEQTGDDWARLLDFFLTKRPARVAHIEPIMEWYDPADAFDATAIQFHQKRRYLSGYASRIAELAEDGQVEIIAQRRLPIGSLFIEGYSYLVWRPTT